MNLNLVLSFITTQTMFSVRITFYWHCKARW